MLDTDGLNQHDCGATLNLMYMYNLNLRRLDLVKAQLFTNHGLTDHQPWLNQSAVMAQPFLSHGTTSHQP